MIATFGFSVLLLSLVICFVQPIFTWHWTKYNRQNDAIALARYSTVIIFTLCLVSFLCLIFSYVVSDFSLKNVYSNSHQLKPLIYKISGTWGNHEGSILLLTLILSCYTFIFSSLSKVDGKTKSIIISFQNIITFGFLAFTIFTSNPFERIYPVPDAGIGLNPILQDIGLAMHPPMLYTGYIGFSLIFSFAISALLQENVNKSFAKYVRPWLSFSWSFLTLGVGLGSWWAYRELGWGGYWFWDAVENVSLMPWLCATALLHSMIILEKTNNFKVWSCFLSILTFIFCLLGVFLVRSGILTSVHSFASDPSRGMFIVLLFLIIGSIGLGIFSIKSHKITNKNSNYNLLSKSGFILINNFIFCLALFIVVLGTLYPIILQIASLDSISVGAPYYATLFSPIVTLILLLMIFIPAIKLQHFTKFNKKNLKKLIISISISSVILFILPTSKFQLSYYLIIFLTIIVIIFTALHIDFKRKNKKQITKKDISYYCMFLAHSGFAIVILAISLNALFSKSVQLNMSYGDNVEISTYQIKFKGVDNAFGKNYLTRIGNFEISNNDKIFYLKPESRYYPVSDQNTSEADIKHNIFSDLYLILGQKNEEDNYAIRIYYKSFISFIWLGCLMMFSSGIISIIKSKFIKT